MTARSVSILFFVSASHVEVFAALRMDMARAHLLVGILLIGILFSPSAYAHDQKEYTIILHSEGSNPDGVNGGILVDTDSLFFRNHDSRDGAMHRILVDANSDGEFEGVDDFDTGWLNTNCEKNETGVLVDSDCKTAAFIELSASNGLLPGNISMIHQIDFEGVVDEYTFYANFALDDHTVNTDPGTSSTTNEDTESSRDSNLRAVILVSVFISLLLIVKLTNPKNDD